MPLTSQRNQAETELLTIWPMVQACVVSLWWDGVSSVHTPWVFTQVDAPINGASKTPVDLTVKNGTQTSWEELCERCGYLDMFSAMPLSANYKIDSGAHKSGAIGITLSVAISDGTTFELKTLARDNQQKPGWNDYAAQDWTETQF